MKKTILIFLLVPFLVNGIAQAATDEKTEFVFLAGGSATGKTTLAQALATKLGDTRALIIHLDEYLDKRVQPKEHFIDGIPNFDNPSMVNWDLLNTHLCQLKNKESIEMPIYSFSEWMPIGVKKVEWRPIVIIEGIYATHDALDEIDGLRIFLQVNEELRYQRRIERDLRERNYTLEFINKIFFEMAIPNEKIFLDPTVIKANIFIENLNGDLDFNIVLEHVAQILESDRSNEVLIINDNCLVEDLSCI